MVLPRTPTVTLMMTAKQRKVAFRTQAMNDGKTASRAAQDACGVTLFHLSEGLKGTKERPMSAELKAKFAKYIGRTVEEVFGPPLDETAPRRKRRRSAA